MIVTHIDATKGQSASTTMEWLDLNPELQLKALCQSLFTLLLRLYHQIVRQLEAHNRLRRYVDVPVAGQSRGGSSSATTHQAAHHQAYAAAGHATHQHAQPRPSGNQGRGTSALALLAARQVPRRQRILCPIQGQ